jgi:hypothetical protein
MLEKRGRKFVDTALWQRGSSDTSAVQAHLTGKSRSLFSALKIGRAFATAKEYGSFSSCAGEALHHGRLIRKSDYGIPRTKIMIQILNFLL